MLSSLAVCGDFISMKLQFGLIEPYMPTTPLNKMKKRNDPLDFQSFQPNWNSLLAYFVPSSVL